MLIASSVVTVAVIAALVIWVDWSAVGGVLRHADLIMFAAAAASSMVLLALRAIRLHELMPPRDPGHQTPLRYLRTTLQHQAVFVLAPSGSGDLAFPPIARLQLRLPWRDAAAALVVARGLDFVMLTAIALVAGAGIWKGNTAAWLTGGVLAVLLVPAFRLAGRGGRWLARKLLVRRRGARISATLGIAPTLTAMAATVASWCAACATIGLVVAALGRPPGVCGSALLLVAINFAGAFAVFTFAGIGFTELGIAGALLMLGYGKDEVIAVTLAARIALLALGAGLPLLLDLLLAAVGLSPRVKSNSEARGP